ncbi:hypothetical protein RB620_09665 [Paenibacillus sp. LHD-117]|uniref:hypothetical protein n=1 Tax=Paenibacillus sp. LHD-117 TaxID=3071412 RepID=UPI0027DEF0CA|nr:hypothetical protein [Paenibacillus sp. LHD-117]MDQ6419697.1 hypothetical protein [Paenibacillus sp. LHD-117]
MPKLNRYLRKGEAHPLEDVKDEHVKHRIRLALQAMEGFVMCQCIAMGILQLIALRYSGRVPKLFLRYLRTPSRTVVSEATVAAYLRSSIFRLMAALREAYGEGHEALIRLCNSTCPKVKYNK